MAPFIGVDLSRGLGRASGLNLANPSYMDEIRSYLGGPVAHFYPPVGLTDDGSTTTWRDWIGGYTVASTSQATRLVASTSLLGFNGRPGVTAVGASSTRLVSSDGVLAGLLDGSQAFTVYTVRKWASGASGPVWACGSTSNGHVMSCGVSNLGVSYADRYDGGYSVNSGVIQIGTAAAIDRFVYTGTAHNLASNSSPGLTGGANTRAPTCNRFSIGARLVAGSYDAYYTGDIGDIIIYLGAHTEAQSMYIERLIAREYDWPVIPGVRGFSASNYLPSAVSAGCKGANGVGVWGDLLCRADAVPSGTEYLGRNIAGNSGWGLYDAGAGGASGHAGTGSAHVFAPSRATVAADVGKLSLRGMSGAHAGLARSFHNAVENGSGSALSAYASTTVGVNQMIASGAGGATPAASFSIFGFAGGNVPQVAANQTARAAAIKAAQRFVATGGADITHAWIFDAPRASYSGLFGADTLTTVGTLTATQIIVPTWPW